MSNAIAIALLLLVYILLHNLSSSRDDSDPPNGRSGLSVYTDCKTGLQYLAVLGALTPRIDANGKQIIASCEVRHD